MKVNRQIQVGLAMLKREKDPKRQAELMTALILLKEERINELEKQVAKHTLNKRYRKAS